MTTDTPEKKIAPRRPPNVPVYEKVIAEMHTRERSNVENYDRALLTLSSASLGLSATFIKDIVAPATAVFLPLLYVAWFMLAATVIATILCYMFGQHTFPATTKWAKEFLIDGDDGALKRIQSNSRVTRGITFSAGVLFIAGLLSLTGFVGLNIHEEATVANKEGTSPDMLRRGLTNVPLLDPLITTPAQPQSSNAPAAPAAPSPNPPGPTPNSGPANE